MVSVQVLFSWSFFGKNMFFLFSHSVSYNFRSVIFFFAWFDCANFFIQYSLHPPPPSPRDHMVGPLIGWLSCLYRSGFSIFFCPLVNIHSMKNGIEEHNCQGTCRGTGCDLKLSRTGTEGAWDST